MYPFLKPLVYINAPSTFSVFQDIVHLLEGSSCLVISVDKDSTCDDLVLWDGLVCHISKSDYCYFEVML
jgi:hypothetical protein